jgi:hypothetical protein
VARFGRLALPILAVPALWPLFTRGLPLPSDVPDHLMRLVALDRQVQAANFYPRWMPNLVLGYGYPLFNYYAPGTYYLAELFRLAGLAYMPALSAAMAALVLVAGLGMWRLATDFFAPAQGEGSGWPALVAASAYMYAPYLLINVHVRGGFAELGAQAMLPWVLWAVRRLLVSGSPAGYVLPVAFGLAGLALAHNLSLLMAAPLLIVYSGLLWLRRGRKVDRLALLSTGVLGAVGLSAFFWWPLLAERGAYADHMLEVARVWLPENVWTWPAFLGRSFAYVYRVQRPYELGLVQVGLATVGVAAARRRWNAEWLFFALLALLASLAIGRPTLPLWLGSDWLLLFQFPWRLLVQVSVPLALFAGASLVAIRRKLWRATVGILLLGLIIIAQRPRLDQVPPMPPDLGALGPAAEAHYELVTTNFGASSNALRITSDFMPRWVDQSYGFNSPPSPGENLDNLLSTVSVQSAGPTDRVLTVSAAQPAALRFSDFYFPGWSVHLDGQPQAPYPSTKLGLLTVNLPAGQHSLHLAWTGTALEQVATWVSLLTLAGLALLVWRGVRAPWLAAICLAALLAAGIGEWVHHQGALLPVQPATPAFQANGLELAGISQAVQGGRLELRPFWYVRQALLDLEFGWRLIGMMGQVVAELRTRPLYDMLLTTSWRVGTLVDDAESIALPGGLLAGDYTLELCVSVYGTAGAGCVPRTVGMVHLAGTAPASPLPAAVPLGVRFGDDLLLAGEAVKASSPSGSRNANGILVVQPGSELQYTLYWQTLHPVPVDIHGFLQLADARFDVLAQQDRQLGPYFFPSRLWNGPDWEPDSYRLTIPDGAPSGLYWPVAGVYDFDTVERLPARGADGTDLGSTVRLAPIKVLSPPRRPPRQMMRATFGHLAGLIGYDLDQPPGGLHPGDTFTVTLYYHSDAATTVDYTRFLHLYAPAAGVVAAQADAPPQQGVNPTSAWVPGEVIVDPVALTVKPEAPAGSYRLETGLYDAAAGGARLAALDAKGNPLPDNIVILAQLTLAP